jgi:hypothetical protein
VARNPFVDEPPPPSGDHGVSYTLPVLTEGGEIITPLAVGGSGGMRLMRFHPDWLSETSRVTDFSAGADGWNSFGTKGVEILPHPDKAGAQALHLRKPSTEWPSAAVWNFPSGRKGQVQLRLKLNPDFGGVRIGLTDHFSVPFDPEESCFNLFNLVIGAGGKPEHSELKPGEWHTLQLEWDCSKHECRVLVDGSHVETLAMQRRTAGVNYLRFTSIADTVDQAGLVVESVEARIRE